MNLQENIQRIREMMGFDSTANELKKRIQEKFVDLKNEYRDFLKSSEKIINPNIILDKFRDYLISKIPDVLEQIKKGQDGSKFAYECYLFVKKLLEEELNNVGAIKKGAIKIFAGNKDGLKKEMIIKDISDYIEIFNSLTDFAFMIGWMEEMKKYENNISNWDKQKNGWVEKNQKLIKTDLINTIINNLY